MTDAVDHENAQRRRRDQAPAFTAMRRCLELHAFDRRRPLISRMIGVSPLGAAAIDWFRAAEGELEVVQVIRALGPDWTVLNAVPIGSGHTVIDHSLVGPAGVVLISLRRHVGSRVMLTGEVLTVDGISVDHLRNANYETERVESALARITGRHIAVTHAVILLGVDHIVHFGHKPSVAVLRPRDLGSWLHGLPVAFDAADVEAVTRIAEDRVRWSPDLPDTVDAKILEQEFGVVREKVIAAENRRRVVGMVTALVVFIAGVVLLAGAAPAVFSIFAG